MFDLALQSTRNIFGKLLNTFADSCIELYVKNCNFSHIGNIHIFLITPDQSGNIRVKFLSLTFRTNCIYWGHVISIYQLLCPISNLYLLFLASNDKEQRDLVSTSTSWYF